MRQEQMLSPMEPQARGMTRFDLSWGKHHLTWWNNMTHVVKVLGHWPYMCVALRGLPLLQVSAQSVVLS